jgi:hypothetical protein
MELKDPAHSLYTSSSSTKLPASVIWFVIIRFSPLPDCLGASGGGDVRAHMGLGASLQMTPADLTLPGLLRPLAAVTCALSAEA